MSAQMAHLIGNLWQWHFGEFSPRDSWTPAINVYRMERSIEVCADLAGLDKRDIDVQVEPGRLIVRGVRRAPDPSCHDEAKLRIISMEIDHGTFCREVPLPEHVDLSRALSRYENGMLWVSLPLRPQG